MKRRIPLIIAACLAAAAACWLIGINIFPQTSRYDCRISGLPEELEGFTIVQVSDVHGAALGKDNSRLLRRVSKAEPDAIAVTGDLVHRSEHMPAARELIEGLCAIAPVYYVTGNHEWAAGLAGEVKAMVEELGGTALSNEYAVTAGGLVIAGCDDPNGYADQKTPEQLLAQIKAAMPDAPVVMLYHRNHGLERLAGADLVLCGHGHGSPINAHSELISRLLGGSGRGGSLIQWEKYRSGMYELEGMDICVSRGIGCSIIPFRVTRMHLPAVTLTAR